MGVTFTTTTAGEILASVHGLIYTWPNTWTGRKQTTSEEDAYTKRANAIRKGTKTE